MICIVYGKIFCCILSRDFAASYMERYLVASCPEIYFVASFWRDISLHPCLKIPFIKYMTPFSLSEALDTNRSKAEWKSEIFSDQLTFWLTGVEAREATASKKLTLWGLIEHVIYWGLIYSIQFWGLLAWHGSSFKFQLSFKLATKITKAAGRQKVLNKHKLTSM